MTILDKLARRDDSACLKCNEFDKLRAGHLMLLKILKYKRNLHDQLLFPHRRLHSLSSSKSESQNIRKRRRC